MVRTPLRCVILLAAALLLIPAVPAAAQKIDDLAHANRIEYNACKYKLAQMQDEARHYDRVKNDLPGMEKQAADLQAKLDLVNPKYQEASQKVTALEKEQKALASELPKVEKECQDAWFPSLSGACSRRNQITKRIYEEINPELARLRNDVSSPRRGAAEIRQYPERASDEPAVQPQLPGPDDAPHRRTDRRKGQAVSVARVVDGA